MPFWEAVVWFFSSTRSPTASVFTPSIPVALIEPIAEAVSVTPVAETERFAVLATRTKLAPARAWGALNTTTSPPAELISTLPAALRLVSGAAADAAAPSTSVSVDSTTTLTLPFVAEADSFLATTSASSAGVTGFVVESSTPWAVRFTLRAWIGVPFTSFAKIRRAASSVTASGATTVPPATVEMSPAVVLSVTLPRVPRARTSEPVMSPPAVTVTEPVPLTALAQT